MTDPYVLPGTTILRNKFNLTTQQDLDDAEADFASPCLRELARNSIEGDYGVRHYLAFQRSFSRISMTGPVNPGR